MMDLGTRLVGFVVSAATLAAQIVGSNPDSHQDAHRSGGEMDGSEEIIILEDGSRFIPEQFH